jgi:hypothetical protein
MRKLFFIFFVLSLILLFNTSVQSKQPKQKALFNLSSDPRYYMYVNYKSSYKSDSTVLMKIVDKRPEQEKSYNEDVQYFYDDIWAEPPDKMLGKIFLKELRSSNMFGSVDFDEGKPSLIFEIELISLIGHYDGGGRVARGTVKIRTVLKSASENRIIMEKYYEETKSSLVGRFTNAYRYMYRNIGEALNLVVKEMVMDMENNLKKESIK